MSEPLKPGDFILITGGVFERFSATVVQVDESRALLFAEIDVFGRKTLVEVPFGEAIRTQTLRAFPLDP